MTNTQLFDMLLQINEGLGRLEGRVEVLDARVNSIDTRLDGLDSYVRNHLRTEMDGRLNGLEANQNVMLGLLRRT